MKTKPNRVPEAIDESTESEITIQPDGRVFAFGITQPLASVLATIPTADDRMKNLLGRIVGLERRNRESANLSIPRRPDHARAWRDERTPFARARRRPTRTAAARRPGAGRPCRCAASPPGGRPTN